MSIKYVPLRACPEVVSHLQAFARPVRSQCWSRFLKACCWPVLPSLCPIATRTFSPSQLKAAHLNAPLGGAQGCFSIVWRRPNALHLHPPSDLLQVICKSWPPSFTHAPYTCQPADALASKYVRAFVRAIRLSDPSVRIQTFTGGSPAPASFL